VVINGGIEDSEFFREINVRGNGTLTINGAVKLNGHIVAMYGSTVIINGRVFPSTVLVADGTSSIITD